MIVQSNARDTVDAIPHSEQLYRDIVSILSADMHIARRAINILKEAHKILTIEVIKEDKQNNIKRVEGYVEAEFNTIKRLKIIYQNALMDEYELQYHRRLMTHQIIKEIYSKIAAFKNTPIGQLANKAIMLEEFEYLLEKNYTEYTDAWKSKKLNELFEQTENIDTAQEEDVEEEPEVAPPPVTEEPAPSQEPQRAIDAEGSAEVEESQKLSPHAVQKLIKIYGINFFFRVQLRKYNFVHLYQIVESGMIQRRDDLKLLKDMIKTVRSNYAKDQKLAEHYDELTRLDQAISHQLLFVRR
ncbi:MAG: hypothetical protein JXA20_00840 [Spirochaetes bacterium]|nr:hypothetical protein [Spirochaetota bacterium]